MEVAEQTGHIEALEKDVANLKNDLEAGRRQAETLSNKVEGNFTLTDHEISWLKDAMQKIIEKQLAFEDYTKNAIKLQVETLMQVEAKSHAALEAIIAKQEQELAATKNVLQRSFEENTDKAINTAMDKIKGKIGL